MSNLPDSRLPIVLLFSHFSVNVLAAMNLRAAFFFSLEKASAVNAPFRLAVTRDLVQCPQTPKKVKKGKEMGRRNRRERGFGG